MSNQSYQANQPNPQSNRSRRRRQFQASQPNHVNNETQSTNAKERNDPLLLDAILVEGIGDAVLCFKRREFKLDFSQFIQIIRSSYFAMSHVDRKNFVSISMFQYYCVILLWKRLQFVLNERNYNFMQYEEFIRKLPNMIIPDKVGYYLDGIGNIIDYCGRPYYLALHEYLCKNLILGVSGHFGRVNETTHIAYETMPAPAICVYRIMWDIAKTLSRKGNADVNDDWKLPNDLKPEIADDMLVNRNLLGWDRCEALTEEQLEICQQSGLNVKFMEGNPVFDISGIDNSTGIPIAYGILNQTSLLISGTKSLYNIHTESKSYKGSLSQTGFNVRSYGEHSCGYSLTPINLREATGTYGNPVSKHICSAVSLFRYRVKRVFSGTHDSLCYTGPQGNAPTGWAATADDIYNSTPEWNNADFRSVLIGVIPYL